jgi:hypothetical protein
MSEKPQRKERSESLSGAQPRSGRPICWYCGSKHLTTGLPLGLQYGGQDVGLAFTFRGTGYAPLTATLCDECGTVVRLHVKETERERR